MIATSERLNDRNPKNYNRSGSQSKTACKIPDRKFTSVGCCGIAHNDSGYFVKVNLLQPVPENYEIPITVEGVTVETEVVGIPIDIYG